MYMLNGRYGQDARKVDFTFQDQWVIDYSITSNKGFTLLANFKIHELDRIYSDGHFLLQMTSNLNAVGIENSTYHDERNKHT